MKQLNNAVAFGDTEPEKFQKIGGRVLLSTDPFSNNIYRVYEKYVTVVYDESGNPVFPGKAFKIVEFLDNNKLSRSNMELIIKSYNSMKEELRKAIKNTQLLIETYGNAVENINGSAKMEIIKQNFNDFAAELSNNNIEGFLDKMIKIENKIEAVNLWLADGIIKEKDWNNILAGRF